jgi:hypothetical protein
MDEFVTESARSAGHAGRSASSPDSSVSFTSRCERSGQLSAAGTVPLMRGPAAKVVMLVHAARLRTLPRAERIRPACDARADECVGRTCCPESLK